MGSCSRGRCSGRSCSRGCRRGRLDAAVARSRLRRGRCRRARRAGRAAGGLEVGAHARGRDDGQGLRRQRHVAAARAGGPLAGGRGGRARAVASRASCSATARSSSARWRSTTSRRPKQPLPPRRTPSRLDGLRATRVSDTGRGSRGRCLTVAPVAKPCRSGSEASRRPSDARRRTVGSHGARSPHGRFRTVSSTSPPTRSTRRALPGRTPTAVSSSCSSSLPCGASALDALRRIASWIRTTTPSSRAQPTAAREPSSGSRATTRASTTPATAKGALFRERFCLVGDPTTEEYFEDAIAYVLANPVRAGLVERPEDWPWSWSQARKRQKRTLVRSHPHSYTGRLWPRTNWSFTAPASTTSRTSPSACRGTASSAITGLSGSGKSSLAFDTIYAEGQRRYVESLSAYARQFLQMMEKPDVDSIDGLSPAISIDQKTTSPQPALDGRHGHGDLRLPAPALRARRPAALPGLRPPDRRPVDRGDRRPDPPAARRARASPSTRRSSATARASTATCSTSSAATASRA